MTQNLDEYHEKIAHINKKVIKCRTLGISTHVEKHIYSHINSCQFAVYYEHEISSLKYIELGRRLAKLWLAIPQSSPYCNQAHKFEIKNAKLSQSRILIYSNPYIYIYTNSIINIEKLACSIQPFLRKIEELRHQHQHSGIN